MSAKRTPCFAQHIRLDAKMVEFAGFEMPIQYAGILQEHHAVREAAGLFDVSHMGEIDVRGAGASAFLQRLTANDVAKLTDGKAQYSLFLNERGGVIDDIIVYRFAANHYLIVVNAANAETDWHWCLGHQEGDVVLKNVSEDYALLALQGPVAETILQPLAVADLRALISFACTKTTVGGVAATVARTGYTGEPGFECLVPAGHAATLWSLLLEKGKPLGLQPCGLGARDTLRLEMGYRLHGHDMTEQTTPFEAGLEWVVKLDKGEFIGRSALVQQRQEGVKRTIVALRMIDPGIPREGFPIVSQRKPVGYVTSGTLSPMLRKGIGLAYVPPPLAALGTKFSIDIRGKERLAEVVNLPFYKKP